MPMQAESLEVLENAAVPPAQARAIVRAIEIELTGARDVPATKHDLLLMRQDLQHEMVGMGVSLRKEMADLGATLRKEMAELGAALRKEIGDVRAEIHASASSVTRQMYLAVLGQSAVMLGFAYFLTTQLR